MSNNLSKTEAQLSAGVTPLGPHPASFTRALGPRPDSGDPTSQVQPLPPNPNSTGDRERQERTFSQHSYTGRTRDQSSALSSGADDGDAVLRLSMRETGVGGAVPRAAGDPDRCPPASQDLSPARGRKPDVQGDYRGERLRRKVRKGSWAGRGGAHL